MQYSTSSMRGGLFLSWKYNMFSEHKESGEGQKRDRVCKALQSTGDNWRCTLWFNMQGYPVKCRESVEM